MIAGWFHNKHAYRMHRRKGPSIRQLNIRIRAVKTKLFHTLTNKSALLVVAGLWLMGALLPPVVYGSRWGYLNTYDGVDLYQALQAAEGSLPFRASADLDVPYQQVVMALVDVERKKLWAPKLKSIAIHAQLSHNEFEYSEYYTTPWPFKDREFLLLGTIRYQPDQVLFAAVDSKNQRYAREDHVKANIEILEFAVIPLAEQKTRVQFTFSGDLGGWIPDFVKSIIQKKWPVRFIQSLRHRIETENALETTRYRALHKDPLVMPEAIP